MHARMDVTRVCMHACGYAACTCARAVRNAHNACMCVVPAGNAMYGMYERNVVGCMVGLFCLQCMRASMCAYMHAWVDSRMHVSRVCVAFVCMRE